MAFLALFAVTIFLIFRNASLSEVLPQEAEQLKNNLTPTGAERGGDPDGTIPAWTGGMTGMSLDADPFAGEAPLLVITGANFRNYQARLPAGQVALFERFPDYSMTIYPTHRTAALPDELYRNIAANATRARAAAGGIASGVSGAAGGIPFPIPHNGTEVVWNHLLAYWGPAREGRVRNYFMSADGKLTLTNQYREIVDFPYYAAGATPDSFGDFYFKRLEISDGPASLAGRGYLQWQPIDLGRSSVQAWQYLPREHRVRKSPLLSHDMPTPDGAGIVSFDDYYVFSGTPDRYDFRIIGKTALYIPYNNNHFAEQPVAKIAAPHHLDQNTLRYELHRVWVVDGQLAKGQHHLAPHRRLYIDEDSWFAVYSDAWDQDGKLWKFTQGAMIMVPSLPAVLPGPQVTYDLQAGGYVLGFTLADDGIGYRPTAQHDSSLFTAESLAAQAAK